MNGDLTLERILYDYGLNLSNPLKIALRKWLQQKQKEWNEDKNFVIGRNYAIDELLKELK